MLKSKKPQLGSVYAIKTNSKEYAFGRVLNEGIEIFTQKKHRPNDFDSKDLVRDFVVGLYFESYKDIRMKYICHIPFNSEDDTWAPPTYMDRPIGHRFAIYHKGEITLASREQCVGLERLSAWSLDQLINRINGDTTRIEILKDEDKSTNRADIFIDAFIKEINENDYENKIEYLYNTKTDTFKKFLFLTKTKIEGITHAITFDTVNEDIGYAWRLVSDYHMLSGVSGNLKLNSSKEETRRQAVIAAKLYLDIVYRKLGIVYHIRKSNKNDYEYSSKTGYVSDYTMYFTKTKGRYNLLCSWYKILAENNYKISKHKFNTEKLVVLDVLSDNKIYDSTRTLLEQKLSAYPEKKPILEYSDLTEIEPIKGILKFKQSK